MRSFLCVPVPSPPYPLSHTHDTNKPKQSVAFNQQLSPFAALLLSAEVDAKDWASDSHKMGLGLTLSA